MFDFLKKRRIVSALSKNERNHVFYNFKEINSIIILFDYDDWEQICPIINDLENEGKLVMLWTTEPKYPTAIAGARPKFSPLKLRLIPYKEQSSLSILPDSIIKEFETLHFNALIDFSSQKNTSIQYLLMNTKAEFCIGIRKLEHNPYDFILYKEENKSLFEVYQQIKFYLNNL